MLRINSLLIAFALSLLVTACASVRPTTRDEAPPAVTTPEGMATLVVARPWHFVDHNHALALSVNDKLISRLPNQSYAYYHVKPGKIRIRGESGVLGWPRREIEIDAAAGDVQYLFWQTKDAAVHEQVNYMVLGAGNYVDEFRWELLTQAQAQAKLRSLFHVSGSMSR